MAAALVGLFAVLWVCTAAIAGAGYSMSPDPSISGWAAKLGVRDALGHVFALPMALLIALVVPLHRLTLGGRIATFLLAAILLVVSTVLFREAVTRWVVPVQPTLLNGLAWGGVAEGAIRRIPFSLPNALAYLGLGYAIRFSVRERRVRLEASETALRLARTRFQTVAGHAQPALLHGILEAISRLLESDREAAQRLLMRASTLLRATSRTSLAHDWPLRDELELVTLGAEVERVRTGADLQVEVDVPLELGDVRLPMRSLHALVQNAVAARADGEPPLRFTVRGRRVGDRLALEIREPVPPSFRHRREHPTWEDVRLLEAELEARAGSSGSVQRGVDVKGAWVTEVSLPLGAPAPAPLRRGGAGEVSVQGA